MLVDDNADNSLLALASSWAVENGFCTAVRQNLFVDCGLQNKHSSSSQGALSMVETCIIQSMVCGALNAPMDFFTELVQSSTLAVICKINQLAD